MNIRTRPALVHNKTTKLAVLFALVGAMMIVVVPMLIEQAHARTYANAEITNHINKFVFVNVTGRLDAGIFTLYPTGQGGPFLAWATKGKGIFGDEKGQVDADVLVIQLVDRKRVGHVTFFFSNPTKGDNTCSTRSNTPPNWRLFTSCKISQGVVAHAAYDVFVSGNGQ